MRHLGVLGVVADVAVKFCKKYQKAILKTGALISLNPVSIKKDCPVQAAFSQIEYAQFLVTTLLSNMTAV